MLLLTWMCGVTRKDRIMSTPIVDVNRRKQNSRNVIYGLVFTILHRPKTSLVMTILESYNKFKELEGRAEIEFETPANYII